MKSLLAVVVLLTFSCKSQKNGTEANTAQQDDQLILLVEDAYYPVETPVTYVIEDAKTLKAFFIKVNRTRKPGIPVPVVDFSRETVLVACVGGVRSGLAPRMKIKTETAQTIEVITALEGDEDDQGALSYPFCVYKIPKSQKQIIIEIL
ncbi:hypothetical protein FGF1_35840 [Flavobacteriaceae bacterium GF1]